MQSTIQNRSRLRRIGVPVAASALTLAGVVGLLHWPIELDGRPVTARIWIDRPRAEVYDFVTTPSHWPSWHPSSLAVRGDGSIAMQVGQQVAEEFSVAGRTGVAHWTVTVHDRPFIWVIDGRIEGSGAGGQVRYLLTPVDGGTQFEREFVYRTPDLWTYAVANIVLHHRVADESARALAQLKRVLEQQRRPFTTARGVSD